MEECRAGRTVPLGDSFLFKAFIFPSLFWQGGDAAPWSKHTDCQEVAAEAGHNAETLRAPAAKHFIAEPSLVLPVDGPTPGNRFYLG